jgi:hypothetical protein
LTRVYDSPNRVQEAEDRLLSLKQGTDSILAYIAKFERVLYEASSQHWPDINKITVFRNGLSSTVCNRLSQQLNLPQKYPDFIRIVRQLAGRGYGLSTSLPGTLPASSSSHPFQPRAIAQCPHDDMDISALEFNLINAQNTVQRREREV